MKHKAESLHRESGYTEKEIDEFLSQSDINDFYGDTIDPETLLEEMEMLHYEEIEDEGPSLPREIGSVPYSREYVDLGLSVKWGSCNLGASKPEEYGEYYAWGETRTKRSYERSKHQASVKVLVRRFFRAGEFRVVGDRSVLERVDDAAHLKLGGSWRIPTREEFVELLTHCRWTWVRVNGISGYKVQSLVHGYRGRWIFLPAAGFKVDEGAASCTKTDAGYWTDSCDPKDPVFAFTLSFPSTGSESDWDRDIRHCEIRRSSRYIGHTIRPVCK